MDWTAVLEGSLSFFLVVIALATAFLLLKIGGTFSRLNIFLKRLDEEVIPLLSRLQVTLDEVNGQLGKLDDMMGILVGVTERVDHTTRTVSSAIASPAKKVAGLSAGVSEAITSLVNQRGRQR